MVVEPRIVVHLPDNKGHIVLPQNTVGWVLQEILNDLSVVSSKCYEMPWFFGLRNEKRNTGQIHRHSFAMSLLV